MTKILVVDDTKTQSYFDYELGYFSMVGDFEFSFAKDISTAKSLLQENTYDRLYLDYDMGGECGTDLLYWFGQEDHVKYMPVLVIPNSFSVHHNTKLKQLLSALVPMQVKYWVSRSPVWFRAHIHEITGQIDSSIVATIRNLPLEEPKEWCLLRDRSDVYIFRGDCEFVENDHISLLFCVKNED